MENFHYSGGGLYEKRASAALFYFHYLTKKAFYCGLSFGREATTLH
jgi:hypothetical protein